MKIKLLLSLCFLLAACSNAKPITPLATTIEEECHQAGNESKQCQVLNLKQLPQDQKENLLGWLYLVGTDGVEVNYSKALYWLEKSAEANNSEALNSLGGIYYAGLGQAKDFHKAEKYFLLAIQNGDKKNAKVNLAELYRLSESFGIPVNFEKSEKWYLLALKENPYRAYDGLSKLYHIQNNFKDFYINAKKAAELGNPESQYNLGVAYRDGLYVAIDLVKARYWFEKAAKQGHAGAIAHLNDLSN